VSNAKCFEPCCPVPCCLHRNEALGSYCGISRSMGNSLVCDRKVVPTNDLEYQFKFSY
jgi:hypothetical protein